MTFQQLQYFLEVHKAGTFSLAAKNLFVTTSSVSITISNLEKELGYPLFIRGQKGLKLTANGQKVLDHATHICERYRQLGNIHDISYNTLHIATTDYAPSAAAITRLIANNEHSRDTNITVTQANQGTLTDVALFETDIGIILNLHSRYLPFQKLLQKKGLAHKVLEVLPIEIVIGKEHRLFHTDTIHAKDLEHEIFIDSANKILSKNNHLRSVISIPQENVIAVQQKDIRHALLSQGLGYTLSRRPPESVCEKYGLRSIPLDGVYTQVICITNPTRPLNDMGKEFLKLLDEEIQKKNLTDAHADCTPHTP